MNDDIECILVKRRPEPTPEALALYESLYPEPCENVGCYHSSCWAIRELRRALGR